MSQHRRIALSVVVGWTANLVKVAIQLIMIPVMARLLGPTEIGLYTLTIPIMAFVFPLSDGGLGESLAREPAENHEVWSTAFWVLQILGITVALCVTGASFVVAGLSHQPRLPGVTAALSTIFVMVAYLVIPNARLTQKGRLVVAPIADMVGNLLGAIIGAVCAFRGLGVWSFVAQNVSVYFFRATIFNIGELYLPRFIFNLSALKDHSRIGGAITATRLVEFGGRIVENTQLSRSLGAGPLGAFGLASQISRFLCEAAANSIWASLYYLGLTADEETVRESLLRLTRLLAMVLFPACGLVAAAATTVLPILLGSKWANAAWPLAILCLFSPFVVTGNLTSAILFARGRSRIPFLASVGQAVGRLAVILCAAFYGLNGVCAGIAVVCVAQGIAMIVVPSKEIGYSYTKLARFVAWPFFLTLVGSAAAYLILSRSSAFYAFLLAGFGFLVIYLGGQVLLDRELFLSDLRGLRTLARRGK